LPEMSQPLFTVVIPVYNRAHLLGETIRSVLAQTCRDFEIIVVDDGSDDHPGAVLEEVGDNRIRLIRQDNSGANTARNRGIDAARGRYVAFLDSDDRFMAHHLDAVAAVLRAFPGTIVHGRVLVDRGGGKMMVKPPRGLAPGEHMAEYLLCERGFVATSSLVVPTPIAREVRFLEGLPHGQDTDFAIRLYLHGMRFHLLPEPSVVWRDVADPDRISSRSAPEVRLRWLEGIRSEIPVRAYRGDRGWFLAKSYARSGNVWKALTLYASAVRHRCYRPRLALVIAMQILFPAGAYRRIADLYLGLKSRI
jgi:glycosyltransferase involved in cell wall biosynthesis